MIRKYLSRLLLVAGLCAGVLVLAPGSAGATAAADNPNIVRSAIDGTVVSVAVHKGSQVRAGDLLMTIETSDGPQQVLSTREATVRMIMVTDGNPVKKTLPLLAYGEYSRLKEFFISSKFAVQLYIISIFITLVVLFIISVLKRFTERNA